MANNPKKQTLLNKSDFQKQQANKNKKRRLSAQQIKRQQELVQQHGHQGTQTEPPKKLTTLITIGVIALIAILCPKPKLITYKKLNMVTQSVYWPGLPGVEPILFDSILQPIKASERSTLYLCQDVSKPDTCQKYAIIETQGFIAAMKHLVLY
ncbi:hypothetical protein L1077_02275 [Pseudoalteromonas luteoviolacea]|uniref:hypothetical protein n=1 Tax=Pseudoalteromonas luteoviolacea TaxID=43657 RepID=UPI001F2B68F1|nr:hypothetical protein [Pseudoalteromonas luteoviolacea]MCF6438254.1 hypothetical protein [Pseudoalteromonas luteoviolacea]